MSAFVMGTFFSILTVIVNQTFTDLTLEQILLSILCSNITNLAVLMTLLSAEQKSGFKSIFKSTPRMWLLFWTMFHGASLIFCPWMRDVKTTLILWLPLFFSGAFAAIVFGPIQDRIVWARQKRKHASTRKI
ncbi:MAG: hypothetical protein KA715_00385 [Xanthomonadaceae bacterium]|nr:hypothetical protein [Xanthomonadaceae bacterium]